MPTPKVRVRHADVPLYHQELYITEISLPYGFVKTARFHTGGHWICVCGKKRNTLRSIQRHVKDKH